MDRVSSSRVNSSPKFRGTNEGLKSFGRLQAQFLDVMNDTPSLIKFVDALYRENNNSGSPRSILLDNLINLAESMIPEGSRASVLSTPTPFELAEHVPQNHKSSVISLPSDLRPAPVLTSPPVGLNVLQLAPSPVKDDALSITPLPSDSGPGSVFTFPAAAAHVLPSLDHLPDDSYTVSTGAPTSFRNIAELDSNISLSSASGASFNFIRVSTPGDGACGLHALFGSIDPSKPSQFTDGVSGSMFSDDTVRAGVQSKVFKFINEALQDDSKYQEFEDIIQGIVNTHNFLGDSVRTPIPLPFDSDKRDYLIALRTIFTDYFGDYHTPAELIFLAKLTDTPMTLLSPMTQGEGQPITGFKSEVYHSSPAKPMRFVVHSGGVHFESWQLNS